MRILFYNWADYLDPSGRGGGVSVYQKATLDAFAGRDDASATFLCAGLAQSLRPKVPSWEALRGPTNASTSVPRFQLVDSLPLSPAHHSYGCHEQIEHAPTVAAFAAFVDANGPFDVIHFNTLEGLPAGVLASRHRWPDTRMVLSLHNYYPFCPQVNLWHREQAHCDDFEEGAACVSCLPVQRNPQRLRRAYGVVRALDSLGIRPGSTLYDAALRPVARTAADLIRSASDRRRSAVADGTAEAVVRADPQKAHAFRERRKDFVRLINAHCDCVLAVSDRTAAIARSFGIHEKLVRTLRIGTDQAPLYVSRQAPPRLPREPETLGLGYLGYMRRDKGFFFLLDALEALDDSVLSRLRLTVAAASRDAPTTERLMALGTRMARYRHVEGYSRADLDDVLSDVELGVVPVLWEDNLPQVAMEMHARRIPLLTSDRGGARELGCSNALVFRAGDAADFGAKLRRIVDGGLDLTSYWEGASRLATPQDHTDQLLALYGALLSEASSVRVQE